MFTMGGVLGAAGAGGGGPSYEDGEIIAQFYDAGTYYNGTSYEWVASNNSDFKLIDPGASNRPVGVDGANRLQLQNDDRLLVNDALKAAISIDTLTVISGIIRTVDQGNTYAIQSYIDATIQTSLYGYGFGVRVFDERLNSLSFTGDDYDTLSTFKAIKGIFTRANKASKQVGGGSAALAAANTGDAALTWATSTYCPHVSGHASADSAIGFIIFIAGAMTSEAWTTFRSTASNNAAYGASGVTL